MTEPFGSADIFHQILVVLLAVVAFLTIVLINMIAILIIPAKLVALDLCKIKIF